MPDQRSLFDSEAKPRKTRCPEQLTERERLRVAEWAARKAPWVLTGALDCLDTLDGFEEECLRWYRNKGRMGVDWPGTVEGWIWRDEKARVGRLARSGSDSARMALLDPARWILRERRADRNEADPHAPREFMSPEGANIISIGSRTRS